MSSRALKRISAFALIAIFSSLINSGCSSASGTRFDSSHDDVRGNGYQNESTVLDAVILTKPMSRSYKCFLKYNRDCQVFRYNYTAGALVGRPDFITQGPKDGRIASCNIPFYEAIDEHKIGRWNYTRLEIKRHNETHYVATLEWTFNRRIVPVERVRVFLTDRNYTEDQMLKRAFFDLVCSNPVNTTLRSQNYVLPFSCYVEKNFIESRFYGPRNSTVALTTVEILDSGYAFYQVADISFVFNRIDARHGFVSRPLSRAKLCQYGINKDCGEVVYEPQSVEGYKGFPHAASSPPDGRIASGNNERFYELDEYGEDRWYKLKFPRVDCGNGTHLTFNLTWQFTATHSTDDIRIYINNENYDPNRPLSRDQLDLNPLCVKQFFAKHPPKELVITCPISLNRYKRLSTINSLLLLSVWNVHDTAMAFYQVIDLQGLKGEQSYESVASRCL